MEQSSVPIFFLRWVAHLATWGDIRLSATILDSLPVEAKILKVSDWIDFANK